MSDFHDTEFDVGEDVELVTPTQPRNLIDLIRRDLSELSEIQTVDIPVAGYESSGLMIRYRRPDDDKDLQRIESRVNKETRDTWNRNVRIATDTMILLCDGVYVQPPGTPEPVALDPEERGSALTFSDSKLSEVLGADPSLGARGTVRKLFGNDELMLLNHGAKLSIWLGDKTADISGRFPQLGG